jgi:RNA polymerase sigma factor (sigma-70 family)
VGAGTDPLRSRPRLVAAAGSVGGDVRHAISAWSLHRPAPTGASGTVGPELLAAWCVRGVMTGTSVDDAELIRAALNDPAPFGTLFDRHFDSVFRFCCRRVGFDLAEDLAGETFRRALEARKSYDLSQPNALPWLFRIALNLVRDAVRRKAAEDRAYARLRALAKVGSVPGEDRAAESADARAQLAQVARLLVAEPQADVDALLLHVWEGLSYADVATALGLPVGTVRSRLSRLRRRLETGMAGDSHGVRTSHLTPKE